MADVKTMLVTAANQGHAKAQAHLSAIYLMGEGVAQNYEEAARWPRKAAEQGNAGAQQNIGVSYQSSIGVTLDLKEAAQ
jgi:TPR repeat protein